MGLPCLSLADQQRIRLGNLTMSTTAKLIRIGRRIGIPIVLENPHSSYLWLAPPIAQLSKHATTVVVDYCRFRHKVEETNEIASLECFSDGTA